jgi:hypothetical protein
MYEALSKQLGDIQLTASSTLTNVNSLSTKASEISGESKSLAAKLGKVSGVHGQNCLQQYSVP